MQICQTHWDQLRKAIADRGLEHLVAKTGEDAMRNMVTELEGRAEENDFDPLMACVHAINTQALKVLGLRLLAVENGKHLCPICEVARVAAEGWVTGPADDVLLLAQEKGLVPPTSQRMKQDKEQA